MRIKFKGKYLGDYNGNPTVGEARVIKRELGLLPAEFTVALDQMDPDATSMLIAIMQARHTGEPVGDHNDIECEYHDLAIEYTEQELAEMTAAQRKIAKQILTNGDKLRAQSERGKGNGNETAGSG